MRTSYESFKFNNKKSIQTTNNRTNRMARAQRLAGKIKIDQFKDKKPLNLDILDSKGFNSTRGVRLF